MKKKHKTSIKFKMLKFRKEIAMTMSKVNIPGLQYIIAVPVILIVLLIVVFSIKGCGKIKQGTPEKVVESLVKYSVEGKQNQIHLCYSPDGEVSDRLQTEIDAAVAYYQAHESEGVKIQNCGTIFEYDTYTYVFIYYTLVLADEQEYPALATYMVKEENGKYYVISSEDITDEMSEQAALDYESFMSTTDYTRYTESYEQFMESNPDYETKIAEKITAEETESEE